MAGNVSCCASIPELCDTPQGPEGALAEQQPWDKPENFKGQGCGQAVA